VLKAKKSQTPKFDLILLGDPAAGKATHGRVLAKHFKLYNLDMGHELRMMSRKGQHGQVLDKTLHQGKLSPTKIVRGILTDRIQSNESKRILFNGTPKMIGEARLVFKLLKSARPKDSKVIVIYLTVSKVEMLRRMTGRKRKDDNREAIENRFKYYKEHIASVVEFFKKKYPFTVINTHATEAEVNQKIFKIIDEFIY
jgi:adenylate kinase family enzyme